MDDRRPRRSSRSRSRERRRSRSRDRYRRNSRSRSRDRSYRRSSRDRSRDRDRSRRSRSRSRDNRRRSPDRVRDGDRDRARESDRPTIDPPQLAPAPPAPAPVHADDEEAKKAKMKERMAAFLTKKQGSEPEPSKPLTLMSNPRLAAAAAAAASARPIESAASAALERPGPSSSRFHAAPSAPPPHVAAAAAAAAAVAAATEDEVDPLDAFMQREVAPEMNIIMEEERRRKEEERRQIRELVAKGKLPKFLEDEEEEPEQEPDAVVKIPSSKVKRLIGAGGAKIKEIEGKCGCRLQIMKTDDELLLGRKGQEVLKEKQKLEMQIRAQKAQVLGEEDSGDESAKQKAQEVPMTMVYIFGDDRQVEHAKDAIHEALDNREQKERNRKRAYDRKKEDKLRQRQLYYLRHRRDYEILQLQPGASKADVKKAYRTMAIKWHPDKHAADPVKLEEAKGRFQEIQRAFESLMSTDEDDVQMQLAG